MAQLDDKSRLWCAALLQSIIGLIIIVVSILALLHGTTVSIGKGATIQVSPWYTLVFGAICLALGLVGLYKMHKDKDEHPF